MLNLDDWKQLIKTQLISSDTRMVSLLLFIVFAIAKCKTVVITMGKVQTI